MLPFRVVPLVVCGRGARCWEGGSRHPPCRLVCGVQKSFGRGGSGRALTQLRFHELVVAGELPFHTVLRQPLQVSMPLRTNAGDYQHKCGMDGIGKWRGGGRTHWILRLFVGSPPTLPRHLPAQTGHRVWVVDLEQEGRITVWGPLRWAQSLHGRRCR